jgi:hemerythrin-like metal-binding protein
MPINSKRLPEQVPSIGLKSLDDQRRVIQRHAVKISGLTEDLVRGDGNATDIMKKFHWAINDLFENSCEHFQCEEEVLVAIRYPFFAEHRIEHNKFIEMVTLLLYESTRGVTDVYGIGKLIGAWTEEHIQQWDMHWHEYLHGTAVTPAGKARCPAASNIPLRFSRLGLNGAME